MVFKKKQTAVDEQIAEIDKLNAVINAAERDMLKLRKVSPPAMQRNSVTSVHDICHGACFLCCLLRLCLSARRYIYFLRCHSLHACTCFPPCVLDST